VAGQQGIGQGAKPDQPAAHRLLVQVEGLHAARDHQVGHRGAVVLEEVGRGGGLGGVCGQNERPYGSGLRFCSDGSPLLGVPGGIPLSDGADFRQCEHECKITIGMIRRLSALFLAALLFGVPSHALAHSPYARSAAELAMPDGRMARLELWYGDGIFVADPVRGQICDAGGAIVGCTPVGISAILRCPAPPRPENCRVFVFGASALPVVWTLDPAGIDWGQGTTRTRVGQDPRRPYPENDPSPAPVGFRHDNRLWPALMGSVLLASEHWRGLGLSLLLVGGLTLVARLAWLWGVRSADGGLAWWRLAGATLVVGSLSLAAGLQALGLVLIVGVPPGLLLEHFAGQVGRP
jgi:hypothetical protein